MTQPTCSACQRPILPPLPAYLTQDEIDEVKGYRHERFLAKDIFWGTARAPWKHHGEDYAAIVRDTLLIVETLQPKYFGEAYSAAPEWVRLAKAMDKDKAKQKREWARNSLLF